MNLDIYCNYCDTQASVKHDKIYMKCHCDDDNRILDLMDHAKHNVYGDYLYSVLGDNFIFVDVK